MKKREGEKLQEAENELSEREQEDEAIVVETPVALSASQSTTTDMIF